MAQTESTTYLLLNGYQGQDVLVGWQVAQQKGLRVTAGDLRLAVPPGPPVPLKDTQGAFGGLANPMGVAVDSQGVIYVSDSSTHRISRIVRREGLRTWAHFFHIGQGSWTDDRFVYVPAVNRLERWPGSSGRDPQSFSEVEVICETVWSEHQARALVLSHIQAEDPGFIDKEWDDVYPEAFPSGELCSTSNTYLPCLGGKGSQPRQFQEPHGLAISPIDNLYVADTKNNRIQVFALHGLVLKKIWGRRDATAGNGAGEFSKPCDVAADRDGNVYIADTGNQRVQKFDCRTRKFKLIDGTVLGAHFFQVLYGPATGERFVFVPARGRLERWPSAPGRIPTNRGEVDILSEDVRSTSAARDLILKTIGAVGAKDILVEWDSPYPDALSAYPNPEPPFASPMRLATDVGGRLYVVDEKKDYVKILDGEGRVIGQVMHTSEVPGRFKPKAVTCDAEGNLLLSGSAGIHQFRVNEECCFYDRCTSQHHTCTDMAVDKDGCLVIVSEESASVAEVPPASGFVKRGTYISQHLDSAIYRCQWHKIVLDFGTQIPVGTSVTVWTYTSETQETAEEIADLADEDWQTNQANARDFLILSPPGRYLWLKIELKGNGVSTPVLQQMKVYFPRQTYLQYLPAVFQTDPVSKDFLERFLSIFETILSSIEGKIDSVVQYFDADGVPEPFLSWLASWVDMIFDPSWPVEKRRQLLRRAAELYRERGTPAGLKKMVALALGVDVQILEHFQQRRWLFLASQSKLGDRSVLWGDGIESRLQLDENSRIGDVALVGTGDPVRDPFHTYAHKFSVFVPAALCCSESAERSMRNLIEREKPAHTQYTLCKVEPRFRVGIQSTLGLDTLMGAYPRIVLGQCATLGYDTLLCCSHKDKGPALPQVGESMRVGVSTVLG